MPGRCHAAAAPVEGAQAHIAARLQRRGIGRLDYSDNERWRYGKMYYNRAEALARIEEEKMTPYSARDLAEDWEFKILRSLTARFRDPARLKAILEEEARAGWTLVEKFDGGRVRLKRPASALSGDAALPFDARRTTFGPGPGYRIVSTFLGALALIAAIFALAAVFHIDGAHF
jgi:hypothetical protein